MGQGQMNSFAATMDDKMAMAIQLFGHFGCKVDH